MTGLSGRRSGWLLPFGHRQGPRCPLEAHLAWICFSLLRWGEIRPFPGDRLTRPPVVAVGRAGAGDIFGRLRQVDLAEYASRYTELRPVGPGRWKGLCPLHREKTASFYIYADPWRWQCYGAARPAVT